MKTPTKPGKSQYFTGNLADEVCTVKIVGFQPGIQKELLTHVAGANQQMPAAPVSLENCIVKKKVEIWQRHGGYTESLDSYQAFFAETGVWKTFEKWQRSAD